MHKAKFILILRSLNKEEFKRFGKFVNSPFFNTNLTIKKFYNALKPFHPEFDNSKIEKKKIFNKIFPDEQFKEKKLRNLSSEMLKLCEGFLAFLNYKRDDFNQRRFILDELKNRNMETLLKHYLKVTNEQLEKIKFKSESDFYKEYIICNISNNYFKNNQSNKLLGNSQKELNSFIYFVFSNLLDLYSNMLEEQEFFRIEYKLILLDEILSYIQKESLIYKELPDIKISFNKLMLRLTKNITYFNNLKKLKKDYAHLLKKDIYLNICRALINFTREEKNKNEASYIKENYKLSREIIKKDLIIIDKSINEIFFLNFVNLCIQTDNVIEAEVFIKNYEEKLISEVKTIVVNLSLARVHIAKKRFSKALEYLAGVKTNHWYYLLNTKYMLFICYYELNMQSELLLLIDTFKKNLTKNKNIPFNFKQESTKFFKIAKGISKIKDNPDKNLLNNLKAQLKTDLDIPHSSWFIKVLTDLK